MLAKALVAVAASSGVYGLNIKNVNDSKAKAHLAAEMTKMASKTVALKATTASAKKVEKKVEKKAEAPKAGMWANMWKKATSLFH